MFVHGTISGTATNGDHVQIISISDTITGSPRMVDYTVNGGDTPTTIATALVALINGDSNLTAASITAQSFGPNFVIGYPETSVVLFTSVVIGVKTEIITLYDYLTLFWAGNTAYFDFLNQIDGRLLILGDGPPTTVVPRQPGVFYYDRIGHITYRADYTDGLTVGGTSWSAQNFSLPVADHSTQGIVELASSAEVLAGTDDGKAATSLGIASAYAKKGDNSDITGLEALAPRSDFAGGRGPWSNLSEATLALLPTQTLKNNRSLSTDGANNLFWGTPNRYLAVSFPTVTATPLAVSNLYILNTDNITLIMPSASTAIAGDVVGFTPGNVSNVILHCPDGSRIMNSLTDFIINRPFASPFNLCWSGVTYGWVISP